MDTDDRPPPRTHTFQRTRRLLDDFFQVDEYEGQYERYDNTMSKPQRLLVFERGDAVAALLYDPAYREVILVEQFRLPTIKSGHGWILEPAAGMIREGETARACIIRELKEETGYQVSTIAPIATFYVSPGGSTERIHLFYAEVRRTHQEDEGGGVDEDGENIKTIRMPIAQFFAKLRNQELEDAKLIIAAQWLRERRSTMPADDAEVAPPVERRIKFPDDGTKRSKSQRPQKYIGYLKGNIIKVHGIDVWVNPLHTDMILDRFTDRTVSAAIRKGGAEKYPGTSRIQRDTIGMEMLRAMGPRAFVRSAQVIDTSPGELARTNGVKRIYHVAATRGEVGDLPSTDLETLDHCVGNILAQLTYEGRYRSVLFPLLGTGEGGLPVNLVAPRLITRAITFLRDHPKSYLEKVYFLAFSEIDADTVADTMAHLKDSFEPEDAPLPA